MIEPGFEAKANLSPSHDDAGTTAIMILAIPGGIAAAVTILPVMGTLVALSGAGYVGEKLYRFFRSKPAASHP